MGLLALIFSWNLHADKFAYPPQTVAATGIRSVQIRGVKGRLILKGTPSKTYKVRVSHSKSKSFEDWSLSVDRQGDALVFEVFNVALGPQWRRSVREEFYPEFDLEVEGPSVPAAISWREGSLKITHWSSNIDANYISGDFVARDVRGSLRVEAGDGQVTLSQIVGPVGVKGQKGEVELSEVHGPIELNWLQGILRGERLNGALHLDLPNGHARLRSVTGPLKALGENSQWDVEASARADVEVVTNSGPVRLNGMGRGSLFLTSATGQISVPKPLRVERREGLQVVERKRVKGPHGQVFVRTRSGRISWQ